MKSIDGFPIKGNGDDGDSMLWAGLLIASGNDIAKVAVKKCQSEDGRIWRSPARVHNNPQNSFSRDMSLGVLLYIQDSGDMEMADRWVSYIKKTGGLFPASESTDTRHIVTPTLWWLMSYVGIKVPLIYRLTRFLYKPYTKFEFMFTPRGYETHLKAVGELILAIAHKKRDVEFGQKLAERERFNPFFAWLAGKDKDFILDLVDSAKEFIAPYSNGDGTYGVANQWSWERSDKEMAQCDSMG